MVRRHVSLQRGSSPFDEINGGGYRVARRSSAAGGEMKKRIAAAILLMASFAFAAGPKHNGVGTWKTNVDQSDYGDLPKPKSETLRITKSTPKELAWTYESTDADGKTRHSSWRGAPDGSMHQTDGDMKADMGFKWEGDTLKYNMKENGGTSEDTVTFSDDGKTMTDEGTFK